MTVKQITLPFAIQAWDHSDVSNFARALAVAGVPVQAWHISRGIESAFLFAAKSTKPPSRTAAAKALKTWFDNSGNEGIPLQEVSGFLKPKFTLVK